MPTTRDSWYCAYRQVDGKLQMTQRRTSVTSQTQFSISTLRRLRHVWTKLFCGMHLIQNYVRHSGISLFLKAQLAIVSLARTSGVASTVL